VTYTRGRIDTIDSPDDEHLVPRNMQRIGINKYKKKNCASSWLFTKIVIRCTVKKKHKKPVISFFTYTTAAQHEARRQNIARHSVVWPAETSETRKRPLTLYLQKPTQNAKTFWRLMKCLLKETYITLHYITNSFCKNLVKIVTR